MKYKITISWIAIALLIGFALLLMFKLQEIIREVPDIEITRTTTERPRELPKRQ